MSIFMKQSLVTLVITSCQRQDLLQRTLFTFFQYNTYPILRTIVIEDSGVKGINDELKRIYPDILWIENSKRLGQIASIDKAYSFVSTPYIFHCEDDWEFYRSGFIEASMNVLETHPNIINVWLRERSDMNGHPIEFEANNFAWLAHNYQGIWHGFTFNPTLKRVLDYQILGKYGAITKFNRQKPYESEAKIGNFYKSIGFKAVILNKGYCRHTGGGRQIIGSNK